MKKLILILFSITGFLFAQNYSMPGGTVNTCSGNFYDTGGNSGSYTNSQNITTTFCSNAGNCIRITFTSFNVENFFDVLTIYDGPTIASPVIGSYTGATSPGTVTSTTGCLTFRFTSDGSVVSTGWAATISCVACPPPPPALCYSASPITFAPDPAVGTNVVLGDDQYSGVVNIGFNFCFDGVSYNQLIISSNNYVDFDLASAGGYSPWSIPGPIPLSAPVEVMRTIMSPWEDLYPPLGGTIRYQTLGVAPNRRFVVSWTNVPMFSCTGQLYTSQLKLFETTNCIEMHLTSKPVCSGWNGGLATQGINNSNGTQAVAYPGRNATQWNVNNDAVRFTPTCAPCSTNTCITPLPVELLSFKAACGEKTTIINWSTASEINNDYFEVERSSDGINFETFGYVDGQGFSNQIVHYEFVDQARYGITYYRLVQTDFDGKKEIFSIISVNCDVDDIIIYPNPNQGVFYIDGINYVSTLTVTDAYGKVILIKSDIIGKSEINMPFAKGVYFLEIKSAYKTETRKIVVD